MKVAKTVRRDRLDTILDKRQYRRSKGVTVCKSKGSEIFDNERWCRLRIWRTKGVLDH